jgi:phosphoribosylglycinamide formyltransferase 1
MKKIVIFTGNELRHLFIHNYFIKSKIKLLKTFSETTDQDIKKRLGNNFKNNSILKKHFKLRDESEKVFFNEIKKNNLKKIKFINKGEINSEKIFKEIIKLNPDLIISFGCSLINDRIIKKFKKKIINIHLGISPYYRGSGTNIWTLINNEPFLFGATFMLIDKGIDTGKILQQFRANIFKNDTPHDIGNRLIYNLPVYLEKIITNYNNKKNYKKITIIPKKEKYYITKDFTEQMCKKLYLNFKKNLIEKYLKNKNKKQKKYPIIQRKVFL